MRFTRALRAPYGDEEPEIITAEELAERWGSSDPALLERALELGIMRPLGDGRFEQASPTLARASAELAGIGISPQQALEVAGSLREVAEALERLRPLAAESLLAMFRLAMDDATEHTFGRQLERLPSPSKQ